MRRNLTKTCFSILVIVFISFTLSACVDSDGTKESVIEGVSSDKFPPFKITSLDGQLIDIEKFQGNVVVVNFWASWCGPCKKEAKELEAVYKAYKTRGVKFAGIAVDDTEKAARGFLKRYDVTYPNALDSDNALSARYKIFAIPTTYVIDKDAVIRFKRQGSISRDMLEREIKKLM
jgi:thiol-disulfide isomerase/thioredoxin